MCKRCKKYDYEYVVTKKHSQTYNTHSGVEPTCPGSSVSALLPCNAEGSVVALTAGSRNCSQGGEGGIRRYPGGRRLLPDSCKCLEGYRSQF